ncbi:uncharacterized phage protein (possible DNA packaging) [Paracoccus alcaliphilus]|uniref:Uncharacterized phage protein (Possible DNA packaging) n=1 Tax=Paracoccus alcaliphilus TaxID=34002 RepID=A0A1H8KDL1_9RHOB|nr:head-tail connector protein [Paracoccus alcaliphilus]WCR17091.1 phage gp6-like head-tail connector protein [Paracoccus alcaliphilus]SEN90626.1 uncharacterized phage protein (possible DNA packaging) [Paracoccus alcaliphilus]
MIIDLAEMKQHLRVDGDDEDPTISAINEAAQSQVANWIGRPIYGHPDDMPAEDDPGYDRFQIVADSAVRVAIKMLAERMYTNRGGEGGSAEDAVPPMTVRALLSGYRVFCNVDEAYGNR